ncbi:MAG: adenylate/guanylate cyclase domain-containing protein [Sneathiella sp.]
MRQELLAPANAIVGYCELLQEEAVSVLGDAFIDDLGRIEASAQTLYDLINTQLSPQAMRDFIAGGETQTAQKNLRHDLRNPLNAIKGYSEMLLEDLEEQGSNILTQDLDKLLGEVNRVLAQLNNIVDFSSSEMAEKNDALVQTNPMITELLKDIRPLNKQAASVGQVGRILVVDDMEANRDLLSRRLSRDGHAVATADGGVQAMQRLEEEDFDLVLLDLMMPDLNGFEVLARMKASEKLRDLPVIMISALDEVDSVIRCIEAGAEDYLAKPFDPVLLRARINASLEKKHWRDREHLYLDQLETEKAKNEKLLLSILPQQVVRRLNQGETIIADRFDEVTVLFSDLVGFTQFSAVTPPADLVEYLNWLFSHFDILANELGVEKVKTIGDAYMVVAGMTQPRSDHAAMATRMAQGMLKAVRKVNADIGQNFQIRIGLHSGPVVAGIVGTHRFVYDVWGDTVNVASRLESSSLPDRIQISDFTSQLLGADFTLEPRGDIDIKGKGKMATYFVNSGPCSDR